MTREQQFEQRLADWIEEGPLDAPDRVIEAAVAHARTHPRRRSLLGGLWRTVMTRMQPAPFPSSAHRTRITAFATVAVVAVVALAVVGGAALLQNRGPANPPAAAPAVSTSVPGAEPTATPVPTLRTAFDLPPYSELVKLFDYDTKEPLGYKVTYHEQQNGVTVYDIEYQSGAFGVFAKLVIPNGTGPFPAVLYAAGHEEGPSFFLPEMVAFTNQGYAGLAIGERNSLNLWRSLDTSIGIEGYAHYVVDLRRGLDLLGTLPKIDAKRIGFVGHELGCSVGSILSGLETRIGAYTLMACGGYVTDPAWSLCSTDACSSATPEERSQYQERLAVLNPVNYIGRGGGAAFLFQASKGDTLMPAPNVEALFAAAPQPKTLTWYDYANQRLGGNQLGCEYFGACDPALPAFADHRAWLAEHV